MKRPLQALVLGLFASAAASAAMADITSSQLVSLFTSKGYTNVQVTSNGGTMVVTAQQNGANVTVTYDATTGDIIGQTNDPFGSVTASGNTSGTNTGLSGENENETETEGPDDNQSGSGSSDSSSSDSSSSGSSHSSSHETHHKSESDD